ncbi:hypothetical protein PVOR_00925 [Paenibacillus vortex V453]|jgi:hypothetical protein|uniref:Uncharacterized protein n=2 Tax=Paenibacillus TaxID=44249 RepID=A0A2R9T2A8_9BACL|nr:hypothetical protein PVOR_00925 [Paenibacillus vortex V453]
MEQLPEGLFEQREAGDELDYLGEADKQLGNRARVLKGFGHRQFMA